MTLSSLLVRPAPAYVFFFFNDTATPEIYPLSLHDALPICPAAAGPARGGQADQGAAGPAGKAPAAGQAAGRDRSEEHTSELQSRLHLVCRLLLEKKKDKTYLYFATKNTPL